MKKKYVFTQTSAPFVGCFTGYAALRMLTYFFSGWYQPDKVAHVLFFGSVIIVTCLVGIFLWGKILVWLRVLSREEAKGYPFSRPWQ